MGKITEMIYYLNSEKYPDSFEIKFKYFHFTPSEQTKAKRKEYKKSLGKIEYEEINIKNNLVE